MNLTINGTTIKTPTKFNVERYPLTKSGRVASGKMTAEIIAWKRKFNFEYASMTATELATITNIIISDTTFFFTLGFQENGVSKTATVYPGAIPYELLRADTWQLTDVSFSLIEQ
jgi:hypothetical protein